MQGIGASEPQDAAAADPRTPRGIGAKSDLARTRVAQTVESFDFETVLARLP